MITTDTDSRLAGVVQVGQVLLVNAVAALGGLDIDILYLGVLLDHVPVDDALVLGHVDTIIVLVHNGCRLGLGRNFFDGSSLVVRLVTLGRLLGNVGIFLVLIVGCVLFFVACGLCGRCRRLIIFLCGVGFVVFLILVGGIFLVIALLAGILYPLTSGFLDIGLLLGHSETCCRQQQHHDSNQ